MLSLKGRWLSVNATKLEHQTVVKGRSVMVSGVVQKGKEEQRKQRPKDEQEQCTRQEKGPRDGVATILLTEATRNERY